LRHLGQTKAYAGSDLQATLRAKEGGKERKDDETVCPQCL